MAATDNCHDCVYAWWDMSQALAGFVTGFPSRPTCANRPGHYGRAAPTPVGRVCPNYRPRPPEPKGENVRRILLTNGMVAYVDAADYEEINQYTWRLVSGGYAGRYEKRKSILMHRQIMNPPEGMQVDHIKGNRLDNTRAHLRVCTPAQNALNRAKPARSASRYFGVHYWPKRRKWDAKVPLQGKQKFLGFFNDEEEAARAYDHAAVLYLDDFARLNFPEEWPPERRAEVRAAAVGANHHSPSSKTDGKEKTEGRGRKTDRKARPRATSAKRRTTKKGKASKRKTPAAQRRTKKGRKPRRATARKRPKRKTPNARRTTKKKKAGGHRP